MHHQKQDYIAFGVNFVSRSVEEPTQERINYLKHILKYLNGNTDKDLKYEKDGNIKPCKSSVMQTLVTWKRDKAYRDMSFSSEEDQ